jgi:phage shock protein PspC (stress-responsive transcriptional regulator)
VIAGVCGALGRHLSLDPVIFRVVLAVLCVSGGIGLFLYGLAWLVIPIGGRPPRRNELQRLLSGHVDAQSLGAVLVTLLGTGVLFAYMSEGNHFFSLLLIALLAIAAVRYDPARHPHPRPATAADAPAPGAEPADDGPEDAVPSNARPGPAPADGPPPPPPQPIAPTTPPAPAWWQREHPPAEQADADETIQLPPYEAERSFLTPVFLLLALLAGAGVWLAARADHHSADVPAILAAALLALAVGLLVGALRGRGRGRALAVPALLLTLALAAVGSLPASLRTGVGREVWAPASAAAVRTNYQLGAGKGLLDLTHADPGPGRTLRVDAEVGVGYLHVVLPADAGVQVTAHTGAGELVLPDHSHRNGMSRTGKLDLPATEPQSHGTIALNLQVGAGRLEVDR